MGKEPSGFESAPEGPVKLVAADPLLGRRHQEHGLEPKAQRNVAGLKDGSNLHSEGLAAITTLANPDPGGCAFQFVYPPETAAMRANGAFRPDAGFHVGVGGFLVVEVRGAENRHRGNSL